MNYRLSVFQAVAEELNFTKAAKSLHISQPAVTKHIKMLEDDLGHTLFNRSRTGVTLTEAGAILLRHARHVARLDEETLQEIRGSGERMSGVLAIGATSTIGQYLLPEWLVESRQRWPGLRLDVTVGNTETVIEGVLGYKFALGLIEGRCQRTGLRIETFLDDEILCVASPRHPLATGRAVPLEALKRQLWIVRERGSGTRDISELALRRHGIDPRTLKIDLELASSEAIKAVVATGYGVTFLSRSVVRRELALGVLRPIPVRDLFIARKLHAVFPHGPAPAGAAQAFFNLLLQATGRAERRESGIITPSYDI